VNWPAYWTSAGATALALAVAMAWHMGADSQWKESESGPDMLLNLIACAIAGAFWPLTGVWLVLIWVNDRARKKRVKP
jgi:hypothetical protein